MPISSLTDLGDWIQSYFQVVMMPLTAVQFWTAHRSLQTGSVQQPETAISGLAGGMTFEKIQLEYNATVEVSHTTLAFAAHGGADERVSGPCLPSHRPARERTEYGVHAAT